MSFRADPGYLSAGLMKPRKEFTLMATEEKLGLGKSEPRVDEKVHP